MFSIFLIRLAILFDLEIICIYYWIVIALSQLQMSLEMWAHIGSIPL